MPQGASLSEEFRLRYAGMSYKQASLEAARLIAEAARTGTWFMLPEQLATLRNQMTTQTPRS